MFNRIRIFKGILHIYEILCTQKNAMIRLKEEVRSRRKYVKVRDTIMNLKYQKNEPVGYENID